MSTVKRTITADKAGMLEHLREQQEQWRDNAADPNLTLRRRAQYTGKVEGIEFAIRALEDWKP